MSEWGPSLFQVESCIEPGVWMIDGFTVRRDDMGRRWFIYGPCDEFGIARTLADARVMIRNGRGAAVTTYMTRIDYTDAHARTYADDGVGAWHRPLYLPSARPGGLVPRGLPGSRSGGRGGSAA